MGRLAKATTTRKNGWYLDPRTATRPDPLFHGTVEPSRVRIGLFKNMLERRSPVWFDVQVDRGPDGGTVLTGTVGSNAAPREAMLSLALLAIIAALGLFSFVIGVVITGSGHFSLAVGAAIGIPVLAAVAILVARDFFNWEDEGRVQPLLRALCALLDAGSPAPELPPGAEGQPA